MAQVIYVACPQCRKEFYVGPEFFSIAESYCHCPYCTKEFSVYQGTADRRPAPEAAGGPGRPLTEKM